MPEPYWRAWLAAGRVAACSASPPLSRRSRAIWTAWAGGKSRRAVAGVGGGGGLVEGDLDGLGRREVAAGRGGGCGGGGLAGSVHRAQGPGGILSLAGGIPGI